MVGRSSVKSIELQLFCEWDECLTTYDDMGEFYHHLQSHFIENTVKVLENGGEEHVCCWKDCSFNTTNKDDLLRHLYFHGYHTKVKWFGKSCCGESEQNFCNGTENRNIIPVLPDGYKCEWKDCGLVWDIPDPYYVHVYDHSLYSKSMKLANGDMAFCCLWEGCSYSYKVKDVNKESMAKYKLRDHLKTHTKERTFACPKCGNLYVNKTKFIDHLNRQSDTKSHTFQCTHCLKTFATSRLLRDHVRHHVNNYKCPHCEMTCPNPSAIRHHFRYKHSDIRPYACQYCDYRSKEPHDLQVHMNFHRSNNTYKCQVRGCDYSVRSFQNLRIHMRRKHGHKGPMWNCHLCSMQYTSGSYLTTHLRTVHRYKWPPGHSRFKYMAGKDGNYRLQTFRYEGISLKKDLYPDSIVTKPLSLVPKKNVTVIPSVPLPQPEAPMPLIFNEDSPSRIYEEELPLMIDESAEDEKTPQYPMIKDTNPADRGDPSTPPKEITDSSPDGAGNEKQFVRLEDGNLMTIFVNGQLYCVTKMVNGHDKTVTFGLEKPMTKNH